jgi:peptidoglycan/xylan/chitin deacetylase (PgdA/CDA1 family)
MKKHQMKSVMWSLLTYDYKNDLSIVKFAVEKYLKPNSIIVLHDSNKSKNIISDSISIIADEVRKRKYQFGGSDECLN